MDENTTPAIAGSADPAPAPPAPKYPTKPTVGRIVLYTPPAGIAQDKGQPFPAIITHVHSDSVVNLAIFNDGSFNITLGNHVYIQASVSQGTGPDTWDWMPYQYAQAAKNDSDVQDVRDEVAVLRNFVKMKAAQVDGLAGRFGPAETIIGTLTQRLDTLAASHDAKIPELQDRINTLSGTLADMNRDAIAANILSGQTTTGGKPFNIPPEDTAKLDSRKADSAVSPPHSQADYHLGRAIEYLNAYVVSPGDDFPADQAAALIGRIEGVQSRLRAAIPAAPAATPS